MAAVAKSRRRPRRTASAVDGVRAGERHHPAQRRRADRRQPHRDGAQRRPTSTSASSASSSSARSTTRSTGSRCMSTGSTIPGLGVRNVVYVATNNDSVYAFDADDPAASAPLWRVNYTNPAAGIVPVSRTDVGQACGTYVDFAGNIGIGGTPVIDPRVADDVLRHAHEGERRVRPAAARGRHPRRQRSGPAVPLVIQASVVGTGDGRDAQNNIAFNAAHAQSARRRCCSITAPSTSRGPRTAIRVRITAGSSATTRRRLQQVMVYNTSPDGGLGGIWHSGGGLTADPAGNLYALTGNGSFNGDTGGRNFGNSFIKVSPAGHAPRLVHAVQLVVPERDRRRSRHPECAAHPEHEPDRRRRQRGRHVCARPQQHGALPLREQRTDRPELSGIVRRAHERRAGVLEQPDLRAGDLCLAGGRSAESLPARRRSVHDAGQRAEHRARAGRHARRDAVAVGQRQRGRHRHPVGDALARRRRQSYPAAGHPARVRREQRHARALEQPAERHARRARQLLEVQPADGGEREGVRGQPVEQAGGLRPDRTAGGNTAPVVNAGADQSLRVAGDADADRHGHRRRQPRAARTAHDDVEPRERAGRRHVQRAERAVDDAPRSRSPASTRSGSARSTARPRRATTCS